MIPFVESDRMNYELGPSAALGFMTRMAPCFSYQRVRRGHFGVTPFLEIALCIPLLFGMDAAFPNFEGIHFESVKVGNLGIGAEV